MKILQINKYFYLKGGAETVFFNTIDLLKRNGHEVIPFCLNNPKNRESEFDSYFVNYPELSECNLLQRLAHIPDFIYNKDNEIVANLLNNSKYAYLPFTDGVSERRGSFLAAIINGAIPITTKGQWTPDSFDSICYYIDDDGINTIIKLLNNDSIVKITQKKLAEFVNLHVANSWADVSKQYKKIIKSSN